jgi:hypothetical protein
MALSAIYTVDDFWREAVRDMGDIHNVLSFEKFNLVNRACQLTQGLMADVVAESYIRETTAVLSTTGKYYVSGASWDVDANRLTATMDTVWASTDVGNLVVFRDGTSVYIGTITAWVSTTVVTLTGDNLPSADIATLEDVLMAGTTITNSQIDISSLRLLRYGTQLNLNLKSTITNQFETLPRSSFNAWSESKPQNRNTIAWTLVGTGLYLKRGSSLSSYGTITIEYPSLPTTVTTTTEYVDLLDGAMVQIGIATLRANIQRRMNIPITESDKNDVGKLITALYNSFNQDIKKEFVEQKLESLL